MKLTIKEQMQILRLYAENSLSTREIAARFGVSGAYPSVLAARRGIKRRRTIAVAHGEQYHSLAEQRGRTRND